MDGAVHEVRAVGGVERQQVEALGELLPDGGERLVEEVGHRQHGGAGVHVERAVLGGEVELPHAAAGVSPRSTIVTCLPAPSRWSAAHSPDSPAPTTTTWSVRPRTVLNGDAGSR